MVHLSIHPLKEILVFSKFLAIMNKAALCEGFLCEHKFSSPSKYQEALLLDCMVRVYLVLKKLPNVFQSDYTISYSYQQQIRISIALYPCQYLVLSVFQILIILVDI